MTGGASRGLGRLVRPEETEVWSFCDARSAGGVDVLHVLGEAGSGRTTLLETAAERLRAQGVLVVPWRGHPGRGAARRVLPDLAEAVASLHRGGREPLEAAIRDVLRERERLDALFAPPELPELPEALRGGLEGLARDPVALVIDDGHFLEDVASAFAGAFMDALGTAAPRLILVASDGSREPVVAGSMRSARSVRLAPLSADGLREILEAGGLGVAAARAGAEALSAGWLRTPHAAALLAEVALAEGGDASRVAEAARQGLRGLYAARFSTLPEAARELLQVASVSMSGINFWRLERLGGADRAEVARLTDALEERRVLRPSFPGGKLRLLFRDGEERLVAYASLDEEKRRMLHGGLARIVEADDLDAADRLSEAGRHHILSGDELQGSAELLQAGQHLADRGRIAEARRHFEEVIRRGRSERALRLEALLAREGLADIESRSGSQEEARRRTRDILDDGRDILGPADRVRLFGKLAAATMQQGGLDEAEAILAEGLALGEASAEVGTARLHELGANIAMRRGDLAAATAHIQRGLAVAARTRDDRALASLRRATGQVHQDRGDLHAALEELQAARLQFQRLQDPAGYAAASNLVGTVYAELRQPALAIAHYREALRIAEALGSLTMAAVALNNLATEQMNAGELEDAERSLERCASVNARTGNVEGVGIARVNLAAVAHLRHRHEEAIERARMALPLVTGAGHAMAAISVLATRLNAELALGRLADAVATLALLTERGEGTDNVMGQMWLLTSQAKVRIVLGDLEGAEEILGAALQRADQLGLVEPQRGFLELLADVYLRSGLLPRAGQALEALARIAREEDGRDTETALRLELGLRDHGAEGPDAGRIREAVDALASLGPPDGARLRSVIASLLPPAEAVTHAREAYEEYGRLRMAEERARAAHDLGRIESALGLADAARHLEEGTRGMLALAAELDDDSRDAFLGAYGRRRMLRYARRLD